MFASDKLIKRKTAILERPMPRFRKVLPAVLALVVLVAGAVVMISCGNSQAQARFVNAVANISGGQAVDVFINGTRYFSGLGFDQNLPPTGYEGVPAGTDTFIAYPHNATSNSLFTLNGVTLSGGNTYTVVGTGESESNAQGLAFTDNNNEPANGEVVFRLINAAPSAPTTLFAYILLNPVQGNGCSTSGSSGLSFSLPYGQSSGYGNELSYSANGYSLYICTAENGNPIYSSSSVLGTPGSSTGGTIRTVVITDTSSGVFGNGQGAGVVVMKDLN
jgi:hypothetical protein